jgi:hypothetical protein
MISHPSHILGGIECVADDVSPWEANTAVIIRPRIRIAANSEVMQADSG